MYNINKKGGLRLFLRVGISHYNVWTLKCSSRHSDCPLDHRFLALDHLFLALGRLFLFVLRFSPSGLEGQEVNV